MEVPQLLLLTSHKGPPITAATGFRRKLENVLKLHTAPGGILGKCLVNCCPFARLCRGDGRFTDEQDPRFLRTFKSQEFTGTHRSTVLVLEEFFYIESCCMEFLFNKRGFKAPPPSQTQKSFQAICSESCFDSTGSTRV